MAPELNPNDMIFSRLPPKAAILSLTHWNPSRWPLIPTSRDFLTLKNWKASESEDGKLIVQYNVLDSSVSPRYRPVLDGPGSGILTIISSEMENSIRLVGSKCESSLDPLTTYSAADEVGDDSEAIGGRCPCRSCDPRLRRSSLTSGVASKNVGTAA